MRHSLVLLMSTLIACRGNGRISSLLAPGHRVLFLDAFDVNGDGKTVLKWAADAPTQGKWRVEASTGRRATGLRFTTEQPSERSVRLFRVLDAVDLRGLRVRLSAHARLAANAGTAEIRVAAARVSESPDIWDAQHVKSALGTEWSKLVAEVDVPSDASMIEASLVVHGTGDVIFDDAELVIVGASSSASISSLDSKQIERLITLIRVIGYARFFYPGDDVKDAEWQSLEVPAVARVLSTHEPAAFERDLIALVGLIAPAATIYRAGTTPHPRDVVQPGTTLARRVHVGFGDEAPFSSFRTGAEEPSTTGLRISYRRPLPQIGGCKRAMARIAIAAIEGQPTILLEAAPLGAATKAVTASVRVGEGHDTAQIDVPPDASGIVFGVFFHGIGSVQISRIELTCDGKPIFVVLPDTAALVTGTGSHLYTFADHQQCKAARCLLISRRPETVPAVNELLDVDVGAGLRLQMPLVLPTDGKATLRRRLPLPPRIQVPASALESRIAAVLDLWIVLRWFYPYFEDQRINWDAAIGPALQLAAKADSSSAQRLALAHLAVALRDDHARVLRPGMDDGILPLLFRSFGDTVQVAGTLPAFTSIPVGSLLVSLDGVPAMEARRRARELVSAATPAWAERHTAFSMAYGHKGTFSTVTFREPHGTRQITQLVPHLDRAEFASKVRERRPATGTELAKNVFYVDLHTLDAATWEATLPKLEGALAVIFDLRGYIGPAAFAPLGHIAVREVKSPILLAPIVTPIGQQLYEKIVWYLSPRLPTLRAKAIFLADARTASAPETILQVVRGERLGNIVGEPTGGTNGDVVNYATIGGMIVRFTALRVLNHDGTALQGHGIVPDVIVRPTMDGIASGRDEILEAAVAHTRASR